MSGAYTITEGMFNDFYQAPFNAYGVSSNFVSQRRSDLARILDAKKNPLFQQFGEGTYFTVYRSGEPIGRIVAHIHTKSNSTYNLKRAYFGFFDCANDERAAALLLRKAEEWGRFRGCSEIAGNFNLTAMQQIGVVTEGFENAPYTDQIYNPPHIPELLRRNGYEAVFPMTTFEVPVKKRAESSSADISPSGWEIKTVNRWALKKRMEDARILLNDGFRNNPMFVPVTKEEYFFQAKDMMWVIDPRISFIAYKDGKPAGVVVCVPDFNPFLQQMRSRSRWLEPWYLLKYRRAPKRAVIVYYAVASQFQGHGLMKILLRKNLAALFDAGYESLGVTWIADVNAASLRQMEILEGCVLHKTHLFRKQL